MTQPESTNITNTPLTIETERSTVVLRQFTLDDAAPLFDLIDQSREHLSQHGDDTAAKYPDFLSVEQSITNPKNPNKLRLGVWDNKVIVGTVNLTPEGDHAEIGYWIGKQFAGNRYATVAAKALAQYASEVQGYKVIFAKVKKANEPSIRSITRAGFKQTGEDETDLIFTYK